MFLKQHIIAMFSRTQSLVLTRSGISLLSSRFQCSNVGRKTPLILKLLTKEDCQLCDKALIEIEEKLPKELMQRLQIVKVDITEKGNENLFDRWRYEIPVFYLENKFLCKNRIDIEKLAEMIK